jgi:tetratricopeptide (TPR) repeat protein
MLHDRVNRLDPDRPKDDASVSNKLSGIFTGPVVQGRDFYGDFHFHLEGSTSPVPWQVPSRPEPFVNRGDELAEIDRYAAISETPSVGAPSIVVVRGSQGVGKTATGCFWAHANHERFRDGQLYVDFREHRYAGVAALGAVLGELLRSLGLRDEMIPVGTGERVKRFRTETAKKQLLLLLDDVQRASEVTQLLPAGAESVVLVTTYRPLLELRKVGARLVELPPLTQPSAEAMLVELIGDERAREEPSAVGHLVEICAGLPIALGICGARLSGTERSVAWLVELLSDETERLSEIGYDEDRSLRAVFDEGYSSLTVATQHLHRRLGTFPGTTITASIAAIAADIKVSRAARLLDELKAAGLIDEIGDQRFRYHDLLRAHAHVTTAEQDSEDTREAAVRRVIGSYMRALQRMDRAIAANRLRLTANPPDSSPQDEISHATPADALAWFESERPNVLAVLRAAHDRELDDQVWSMGEALWLAYRSHGHWDEAAEVFGLAADAAHRSGHRDAEARMRSQLARAYMELDQPDRAMDEFIACDSLMDGSSNQALAASIVEWTGVLQLERRDDVGAIRSFEQAKEMFEEADVPRGVVMQQYLLGRAFIRTGSPARAVEELRRASEHIVPESDQFLYGRVLWRLGDALVASGRPCEGRRSLEDSAGILRRHSAYLYEAQVRESIAALERDVGDTAAERRQLDGALAIYAEFGDSRSAAVKARLVSLEAG